MSVISVRWNLRGPGRRPPRVAGFLAALMTLTLGCGASDARQNGTASGQGPGAGPAGGRPAPPVAVAAATRRTLARSVSLSAPVEPVRRIGVNSQMTGTVLRVEVQEGDRVRTGDLMAQLDTREVEAQLERARATLANAEAAYRRATEMHDRSIITDAEYEQARATYATGRSDVALWETRLGFGHIRAPASGMVTAKLVEAGSAVSPNQRMFELADESLLVVRVQASELDVVHLGGGEAVQVMLDAYPDVAIPGRVRRVFPAADPTSRLVPVEVALGTPPVGVQIRPGFLARVRLDLEQLPDALAVPVTAIGTSGEGPYVLAVVADTLERRAVDPGLGADGWVQVRSGLSEGDQVVISSLAMLRPGMRVRIADLEPQAPVADSAGR